VANSKQHPVILSSLADLWVKCDIVTNKCFYEDFEPIGDMTNRPTQPACCLPKQQLLAQLEWQIVFTVFVWALCHQTINTWPKECACLTPWKTWKIPQLDVCYFTWLFYSAVKNMVGMLNSESISTTTALQTIWPEVSPECCSGHPAVTNVQIWTHLPFSNAKPQQDKRMEQQAGASHESGLKLFS